MQDEQDWCRDEARGYAYHVERIAGWVLMTFKPVEIHLFNHSVDRLREFTFQGNPLVCGFCRKCPLAGGGALIQRFGGVSLFLSRVLSRWLFELAGLFAVELRRLFRRRRRGIARKYASYAES